ncbi:MAG: methyl-accepting chemotaxis protein, partial [Selenomonadaceae bacterium]
MNEELENLTNEEILRAFKIVIPYINKIVREDIVVGLTDKKEYIGYARSENLDIQLSAGKSVNENPIITKCMNENTTLSADADEKIYGKPIKTIFTPIHGTDGTVIGSLSSGVDMEANQKLIKAVK